MTSRDVIKLYLADSFYKNNNFKKLTLNDISRRFAFDMSISLTSRIYKKFKKVAIEFLIEIMEVEGALPGIEIPDVKVETPTEVPKSKGKKKSANVVPNVVIVQRSRKGHDDPDSGAYYALLNVFKKTGLPMPRVELTEAATAPEKILVLQKTMQKAGHEGEFTLESAKKLKEKLSA